MAIKFRESQKCKQLSEWLNDDDKDKTTNKTE